MYVGIIAAGGASSRTGLGAYTNKAALSLGGRTLLGHQLDFFARSGVERAFVIVRQEHVRLLSSRLSRDEQRRVAFIVSDCASGWAGEVERAQDFIAPDDEVLLVSCDNLHTSAALRLHDADAFFTYTTWTNLTVAPTNGPILGRCFTREPWRERDGVGFVGELFTGYAVVRGRVLTEMLRVMPRSNRGEKEFTSLLSRLSCRTDCRTVPYPGTYDDVADVPALARFDARTFGSALWERTPTLGAGIVLHDGKRVLLTERTDGRGWVPPGGICDPGETFAQTAVREVREEIGVDLDEQDLRLLGVYPTRGKEGEPACSVLFHANWSIPKRWNTLDANEVTSIRWFTQEEAATLKIPFDMDRAISDYFAGRELDVRGTI